MTPEEQLKLDVEKIVNGVIGNFPFPIKDMLKRYGDKLTKSIVEVSSRYVRVVVNQQMAMNAVDIASARLKRTIEEMKEEEHGK